jgi:uncharacterized protein (TIGR02391 family)
VSLPPFGDAALEGIARAIGDPVPGSQVDQMLAACGISIPPAAPSTKWRRLYMALDAEQRRSGSGASVARYIQTAAQPQRWAADRETFDTIRARLNPVLAFDGLTVGTDGSLCRVKAATTHDEAAGTARRLHDELVRRGGHAEVFRYCSRELVAEDCFSAVFEAVKGLGDRVRQMTGLDQDGQDLANTALRVSPKAGSAQPQLALNSLRTVTERNEQNGVLDLMLGVFSAFRNPPAHEPRQRWHVSEADALDLLSTLSLIHRRLDGAVRTPRAS